jgi:hypothetical protein
MMAARPGHEIDRDPLVSDEDRVCATCGPGRLIVTREPRSPVLRVVGFTLWADAVLTFVLGMGPGALFVSGANATGAGRSIGIPVACLLLFVAGLFLTLKRDVWRCATCGQIKRAARRRAPWFPSIMRARTD